MRRRPESTTSERELIDSLAAGGRSLPLSALAAWRKHGLLPPLESYGTGAGRTYYWHDPRIRKRATTAFDLLEKHCQVDRALWGLWLRGFHVPAVKLRRAWRQCRRIRSPWLPSAAYPAEKSRRSAKDPGDLLAQATRMLGLALPADMRIASIIEHAVGRLGGADGHFESVPGGHCWTFLQMAGLALESSALLDNADDRQLGMAQHFLALAGTQLAISSSESDAWNDWLADRVGPPLALVILALLRSGQADALEALASRCEDADAHRKPARIQGHHVTT